MCRRGIASSLTNEYNMLRSSDSLYGTTVRRGGKHVRISALRVPSTGSAAQRRGSGVCAHAVEPRPADADTGDLHLLLQQFSWRPAEAAREALRRDALPGQLGFEAAGVSLSKGGDRPTGAPAVYLWRRGDRADHGRPVYHPKHRLPRK